MFASSVFSIRKHIGYTFTELLVALALSLLLMSFLFSIFLTSLRSSQSQAALRQIQSQAEKALRFLGRDIAQAGFTACQPVSNSFKVEPYTFYSLNKDNKIQINQDNILVRHASPFSVILQKNMQDKRVLQTGLEVRFSAGDVLMITDCQYAEIFVVEKVFISKNAQTLMTVLPLHYSFKALAQINRFEMNRYSIKKTKRKYQNGSLISSLIVTDIKGRQMELVEGIAGMRFSAVNRDNQLSGVLVELDVTADAQRRKWHGAFAL